MSKQLQAWMVIGVLVASMMFMGWIHFHQARFGVFVIIFFFLVAAAIVFIRFLKITNKNHQ